MPDVYLTSNCTVEMISRKIYEDFLLPADIKLAEEFKPFGIHHCGQTMEHVADGYKKVKILAFAEVGAGSDILKVRQALPGVFLNLRYSPVKIKTATQSELMHELEEMAAAAGVLFSIPISSSPGMVLERLPVPLERIMCGMRIRRLPFLLHFIRWERLWRTIIILLKKQQ